MRTTKGVTLVELMITAAVLGILALAIPRLIINLYRFFSINIGRAEIQRDARISLDLMNRKIRQARASTVVVARYDTNQPYYSQVTFDTLTVSTVTFWQQGQELKMKEGTGAARKLADNLRYLAFTYGETDNDHIMSISVTFEKTVYAGKSKALQMAVEKVRIMNE